MATSNNDAKDYTDLLAIKSQIKVSVTDKKQPNPDPTLIIAQDLSTILNNLADQHLKSVPVPNPADVTWLQRPGQPIISNNLVTETASSYKKGNTTVNAPQQNLTVPFSPAGGVRRVAVGLDTGSNATVYSFLNGQVVDPVNPIPSVVITDPNFLYVHELIVGDGLITVAPIPGEHTHDLANPANNTNGFQSAAQRRRISRNVAPFVNVTPHTWITKPTVTFTPIQGDPDYNEPGGVNISLTAAEIIADGVNYVFPAGSMGSVMRESADGEEGFSIVFQKYGPGDFSWSAPHYHLDDSLDSIEGILLANYIINPDLTVTERMDWGIPDIAPAENDNMLGFFAGLLNGSGRLSIKSAVDKIVSSLKTHVHALASATTNGFFSAGGMRRLNKHLPPMVTFGDTNTWFWVTPPTVTFTEESGQQKMTISSAVMNLNGVERAFNQTTSLHAAPYKKIMVYANTGNNASIYNYNDYLEGQLLPETFFYPIIGMFEKPANGVFKPLFNIPVSHGIASDGTIIYPTLNGGLPLPAAGTGGGGGADLATVDEDTAGTVTNKASTPGGRTSWWAAIKSDTTTYFSQKIAALKLELGQAVTAGTSRVIEALGVEPDIDISVEMKGNGALKSSKWTGTAARVPIIDALGKLFPEYEVQEEQVAVPTDLNSPGVPGTWAREAGFVYFCYGAGWEKLSSTSSALNYADYVTAVPTTTTTPAGAFPGQIAYDAANGRKYEWTGAQWVWTTINTAF